MAPEKTPWALHDHCDRITNIADSIRSVDGVAILIREFREITAGQILRLHAPLANRIDVGRHAHDAYRILQTFCSNVAQVGNQPFYIDFRGYPAPWIEPFSAQPVLPVKLVHLSLSHAALVFVQHITRYDAADVVGASRLNFADPLPKACCATEFDQRSIWRVHQNAIDEIFCFHAISLS